MRRLELLSFLIGAAAALVLLAGWRVPEGRGELGADVTLSIGRSGIVELSRTGTVVDARRLLPGRTVRTEVVLHNPGRTAQRLRPRFQLAVGSQLARVLRVDVRAGGERVYAGTFHGLTRPAETIRLRPGESKHVTLAVGLPRSGEDEYAGRSLQASLVFEAAR
jgi:hypothetical protein